ncbi:MAG: cupin domain-containing protein [Thermodesulfobacteriota bacterium]
MKLFRTEDYIQMKNPTPGKLYRPEILTAESGARDLGGMLGLLVPGSRVPYHYHKNRESVLLIISGEGVEVVEGAEFKVKTGDILFIPAGEKHAIINRSEQDLRYLEFFTCPPVGADFVEVQP